MHPQPPRSPEKLRGRRRAWIKRSAIVVLPFLCLLIFGTVIGARLISNTSNAHADTLVPITGHIPALEKTSTVLGPTDTTQNLSLSVGLQLRNSNDLKSYVANINSANSITTQHLTQAQVAAAFAPLASSQQSLIDYLQGYGFTVNLTMSQHLVIGIQGTVGDAENAFHLQINNYQSKSGQQFYAPSSEPLLPDYLAALVQNIGGLDNVTTLTHPPIKVLPAVTAAETPNTVSCPTAGEYQDYLPSQIAGIYNLNGFYNAGLHGEGQTVALVEFDDYNATDVSAYTHCYGGGSVPVYKMLVDGGTKKAPGADAFEVEMDMELILSAAPKLAGLDVYEAPNSQQGSNDMWAQIINNDAVSVISTSWGSCEQDVSTATMNEENSLFALAAAQGQTILAAAGDYGTNACQMGWMSVDDPASQPYVTGVGGTTLTASGNTYGSEVVWKYTSPALGILGGGGGLSSVWSRPAWQSGPGVNSTWSSGVFGDGTPNITCGLASTSCREVPDVTLNADANFGYAVYCTVAAACAGGSWWSGGGTSAGAPMWAAFIALTNELSLKDGGFNIGFVNPLLYQIEQNSSMYANDFHDITVGDNDTNYEASDVLPFPATANYDMASGLGSYNGWNLGQDLGKLANMQNGSRNAPANKTWYFAEGSVGGSFLEFLTLLNPGTQDANVTVQYLFPNQSEVTKNYVVKASTRYTIEVNNELGISTSASQVAISAIVTSNVSIVAERPMYFDWHGIPSGSDVLGATNPNNTTFYFAQGDTNQNSNETTSEFITILNPSSTQTANVSANFYSGGKVVATSSASVPPLHRGTIVTNWRGNAAIKVSSNIGIVVERPLYFKADVANGVGWTTGANSAVGATSLGGANGSDWLFAEGFTGSGFQEYLVLANFTGSDTQATIKLEYTNGTVQTQQVTVKAQSQLYFDVNNANHHPASSCSSPGCIPTDNVSAEVTSSTASIVAERVMYFHYKGKDSGGTDAVGEAGPSSQSTYSFAEGYTSNSFEEWLTLQNPMDSSEVVAVTFFVDQTIVQENLTLPAHSRTTVNVNSIVDPIASAYPPNDYAVSLTVQALGNGTVVAERPLYFDYDGSPGGTDVIGYTGN